LKIENNTDANNVTGTIIHFRLSSLGRVQLSCDCPSPATTYSLDISLSILNLYTLKIIMNRFVSTLLSLLVLLESSSAFAPLTRPFGTPCTTLAPPSQSLYAPVALQRQRKSVAQVQTQSLFGLGAPEIAIILVAAAFLLGPEKLAELGKDAGKIAGELKEVPKEFQEGLKEGEAQAAKTKAKLQVESTKEDQA
jgi:sec-independent protein translocase protein TatA